METIVMLVMVGLVWLVGGTIIIRILIKMGRKVNSAPLPSERPTASRTAMEKIAAKLQVRNGVLPLPRK